MMGYALIILCLLGTGLQFSVAVDEITSEQIVSVANEANATNVDHGEYRILE